MELKEKIIEEIKKINDPEIPVNNYDLQLKRLIDSYCIKSININDGDTVLDCGANVGELNIALKSMEIYVNYIGFEPDPDTFECLKLNNPEHQNVFHMNALSNKDGKMVLNDGKNSVEVPEQYKELTKFSFENKSISAKGIKTAFPLISEDVIHEFVDAMKKMKVFI